MANQYEVSIEIIIHATEDSKKIIRSFSEVFDIKERQFTEQHLTGHFENPILLFSARIAKNKAEDFVQKLILKIPKEELRKIIGTLENRIQNSSLQ